MQSVRFLKEGLKHYMVVPCNDKIDTGYRSRMLQHRPISYYLQYEIREFNGKQVLYYRLKYHTTMKTVMDHLPFTLTQVKNIISSIIGVMEVTDDYLLCFEAIVWRVDRVFIEVDTGKLEFCYNPIPSQDNGNYKDFLSEIKGEIGKKNEEAMLLFSEFYNLVTKPECTVEQLIQYRKEKLGEEDTSYAEPIKKSMSKEIFEAVSNKLVKEEFTEDFEVRDSGFGIRVVKLTIAIMTITNLLLVIGLLCNVLTYDYIKYLLSGIGVLIAATILHMQLSKDESVDDIMQAYLESLPEYGEDSVWVGNETTILKGEIVEEDKPMELCLMSVIKDRNPTIYVKEHSVVLGCMEESCDYVLKVDGVSRMHAKLIKKEDGLYMSDLNSTNGTYLNGKLIESGRDYKLKEGDVVAFARIEFFVTAQ